MEKSAWESARAPPNRRSAKQPHGSAHCVRCADDCGAPGPEIGHWRTADGPPGGSTGCSCAAIWRSGEDVWIGWGGRAPPGPYGPGPSTTVASAARGGAFLFQSFHFLFRQAKLLSLSSEHCLLSLRPSLVSCHFDRAQRVEKSARRGAWRRSPCFLAQVRLLGGDLRHHGAQELDLRRRSTPIFLTCASNRHHLRQ